MCYRIFMTSGVATFFLGVFVFFLGMHWLPGLAPITLPIAALLAGTVGLVNAVSGLKLIWTPDARN